MCSPFRTRLRKRWRPPSSTPAGAGSGVPWRPVARRENARARSRPNGRLSHERSGRTLDAPSGRESRMYNKRPTAHLAAAIAATLASGTAGAADLQNFVIDLYGGDGVTLS